MSITINIDKAKDIQKDRWRIIRAPMLESLDVEFLKAVESGDVEKQNEIAEKKQELRDVTKTDLSEINTIEELKQVWPDCLEV